MYTYNILCFGHELSANKELNNFLLMYDVEFFDVIKGNEWQVSFPYHGGQVKGDTHSCVFGTIITDDDDNPLVHWGACTSSTSSTSSSSDCQSAPLSV